MKRFLQSGWPAFVIAVAVIIALSFHIAKGRKDEPTTPITRTSSKPEYIYLQSDATAAIRRADSLQVVADFNRQGWNTALKTIDNFKKQVREAENFITDVRNGAVAGNMSMEEATDYLLRYLNYIK